jgi:hypothetical protein
MAIEPTSVQRDRMLARGKTKLFLAQFLDFKDPAETRDYFLETCRHVQVEKGTRDHQLKIQQTITKGKFPYQYLVVDQFSSSQALLMAHEKAREIRLTALNSSYAILIQPNPRIPKIAKSFGFMESAFTRLLGTSEIKSFPDSSSDLNAETDPDLDKVKEFGSGDLTQAFYMVNLNQFIPGGKRTYNQYSTWITPYLISVGGYPVIYGKILGTYIGDQKDSLFNSWHDFALIFYPSRTSFLRLMTNTPRGAAKIRRSSLIKVTLMACG